MTVLLAAACDAGGTRNGTAPAPELRPIDSLVLREEPGAPIGMIRGFAVTASGELVVADDQQGRLLVFARDGSLSRTLGRRGEGPGEWSAGPYLSYPLDPAHLIVSEGSAITVVSIADGSERWSLPATPLDQLIQPVNGFVVRRAVDRERRSTLSRFPASPDSAQEPSFGGPFPFPLGRSNLLDRFLSWPNAAGYGRDSIAAVVSGSDFLFIGPFEGPFDSIAVPARVRRGAMPEVMAAVRDDDPGSMMRAAYKSSYPLNIAELPTAGHVALVLLDHDFPGDASAEVARLYLSVVDVPRRRACVDARIPAPTDPLAYTVIRGDTLLVLTQEVDTAGTASRTMVRRYGIDTHDCAWQGESTSISG